MKRSRIAPLTMALLATLALGLPGSLSISGCGGGAADAIINAPQTNAKLTVNWAARSRATVEGPSSAQSFKLAFSLGNPSNGGSITFPTVTRPAALNANVQNYVSPTKIRTGPTRLNIRFFSNADGTGTVVAEAFKDVVISTNGELLETNLQPVGGITLEGKVASVEVTAGQSVTVGETKDLTFSAKDSANAVVAVSPGSATFNLSAGGDALGLTAAGAATGKAVGTATVTATVDGKTSPAATVNVVPNAITVTANQSVKVGETKDLVVTGTNSAGETITIPANQIQITPSDANLVASPGEGKILGVGVGSPTVTATVAGKVSAPTAITVVPNTVVVTASQSVKVGETKDLAVTGTNMAGETITIPANLVQIAEIKANAADLAHFSSPENGKVRGIGATQTTTPAKVRATVLGINSADTSLQIDLGAETPTGSGLVYQEIRLPSTDISPKSGKQVEVHYVGYLASNGQKFDSSIDRGQTFKFTLDVTSLIDGFEEGVRTMKVGGERRLLIPSNLGYGPAGAPPNIPPNADLIFDIQLVSAQQ